MGDTLNPMNTCFTTVNKKTKGMMTCSIHDHYDGDNDKDDMFLTRLICFGDLQRFRSEDVLLQHSIMASIRRLVDTSDIILMRNLTFKINWVTNSKYSKHQR